LVRNRRRKPEFTDKVQIPHGDEIRIFDKQTMQFPTKTCRDIYGRPDGFLTMCCGVYLEQNTAMSC
jgi:hypothetical protein